MRNLFLLLLLLTGTTLFAQQKSTITVGSQNNPQLHLDSAYIYRDSIVIVFSFMSHSNESWINIERGTEVIIEENGYRKSFKMLYATGVPYSPDKKYLYSTGAKLKMQMTFPNFGKYNKFWIFECNKTNESCFNFNEVKFHF